MFINLIRKFSDNLNFKYIPSLTPGNIFTSYYSKREREKKGKKERKKRKREREGQKS